MFDDLDDDMELDEEELFDEGYEEGFFDGMTSSHTPRSSSHTQGCYVATCVYGSYDCPEVWTLRRFRDRYLKERLLGRGFIKCYYTVSPWCVDRFGDQAWFRCPIRKILDLFIKALKQRGYSDEAYIDQLK